MLSIRSDKTYQNVQVMVGDALLLLGLLYHRAGQFSSHSGWELISSPFAAGHLPVEHFTGTIERGIQAGWSVFDWLHALYERDLWLQHRMVVLNKMTGSNGKETSKFDFRYDEGPEFGKLGEPYFQGLGTDEPKMNGPRFPSALSILSDLRVIQPLDNNAYRLTQDGEDLLEKFKSYQIPETTQPAHDETPQLA